MLYNPEWKAPATTPVEVKPIEPWRKLLLDAAQTLRERGWVRGTLICRVAGSMCVQGAIFHNVLGSPIPDQKRFPYSNEQVGEANPVVAQAWGKLIDHLGLIYYRSSPYMAVVNWNNHEAKDKEEVIAALEGAANAI